MIKNGWIRDTEGAWWPLRRINFLCPTDEGVFANIDNGMQVTIYKPLNSSDPIANFQENCDYLDDMMGIL